ncbi:MAG: c-type cytochrome biogenesis protein CcmI [Gammaproteobacteria bacterium]|nr:c-type cytochrome biogenesis protein CcmI [Gammaproteobacteria bacterium]
MVLFSIGVGLLLLLAIALLAPTLLRTSSSQEVNQRSHQNIAIARDRLAEMEREQGRGEISDEEFQQAKVELEQMLLIDLETPDMGKAGEPAATTTTATGRLTLIALVVIVPLLSLLFYQAVGSPALVAGVDERHTAANGSAPSMAEMVRTLEQKLQENPENGEGWYMLGRTRMVMENYTGAAVAFENALRLLGNQAGVMLAIADASAMANGGKLTTRGESLVTKALQIEPDNSTALWMGAIVAEEKREYTKALAYLQRLQPQLEDEAEKRQVAGMMSALLAKAGTELPVASAVTASSVAPTPATVAEGATIMVEVTLDPALSATLSDEMTLFVYAKALNGPRFPLAAYRGSASELPLQVVLTEEMAMVAGASLANFSEVKVGARLSLSGDAITRSGDLLGEISPVSVGDNSSVAVVINTMVP